MNNNDNLADGASALLIATNTYSANLPPLVSPADDARKLAMALSDPAIGGYDVQVLIDEQTHRINEEIEGFFADRSPRETLLLYLSCHGIKDEANRLRFATTSTKLNRLVATTISAEFIYELVSRSRAGHILLLLDCCYSGAYLKGHHPRSVDSADIEMRGRGRAAITSCTSIERSFEIDTGLATRPVASVFTSAIIDGLLTGDADRDADGLVSVDDLYNYVLERVREATPHQTPEKKYSDVRGGFIIARNPYPPAPVPEPLPNELNDALASPYPNIRTGAVKEIAVLAQGSQAGVARTAREILRQLITDDSKAVSAAAQAALADLGQPAIGTLNRASDSPVQASSKDQQSQGNSLALHHQYDDQISQLPLTEGQRNTDITSTDTSSEPVDASKPAPSPQRITKPTVQTAGCLAICLVTIAAIITVIVVLVNRRGVNPLESLSDLGSSGVDQAAFSGAGTTLAAGDANGTTYLWNLATRKITTQFNDPESGGVNAVAFNPDGTTLAAGDANGTTYLWNLATGKITAHFRTLQSRNVYSVAFNSTGTKLVTGDSNGSIYVWNLSTGKISATYTDPGSKGVNSATFNPQGTIVAAGDEDGSTYSWDLTKGRIATWHSDPDSKGIGSVAFNPSGAILAVGDDNGSTYLWNLTKGTITATYSDPGSKGVYSVAFNPSGTILATGDSNGHTYLWNLAKGTITATYGDPGGKSVDSVAFNPSGTTLATGDSNGHTYLWTVMNKSSG